MAERTEDAIPVHFELAHTARGATCVVGPSTDVRTSKSTSPSNDVRDHEPQQHQD